jgi:hypothetical protein
MKISQKPYLKTGGKMRKYVKILSKHVLFASKEPLTVSK